MHFNSYRVCLLRQPLDVNLNPRGSAILPPNPNEYFMGVSDLSFDEIKTILETSKKPVVVELHMPDCRSCRLLEATLSELSNEFKDEVIFCKCRFDEYDGDRSMDTVPQLSIHAPVRDSVSNKIIYGSISLSYRGTVSKDKLREALNEELDKLEDLFDEDFED